LARDWTAIATNTQRELLPLKDIPAIAQGHLGIHWHERYSNWRGRVQ